MEGYWIDHTYESEMNNNIECPFCHMEWSVIDNCTETFNYCPNCGVKLEENPQYKTNF